MKRRVKLNPIPFAAAVLAAQFAGAPATMAAEPSRATVHAYDDYLRQAEARMEHDYLPGGDFLSRELLAEPGASAKLDSGSALVRCVAGCNSSGGHVPGGLIHDWLGVVFIPGVSLEQVLALVQDYDHSAAYYAPNVTRSRLLSHSGDEYRVFLQFKQTELITVLFDTEYEVRYVQLDPSRVYSISHSTRVAQLARGSQNRELPPAENQGFLWRLDSYWRFERVSGGVYVQCRAISLSRDIPPGLAWIAAPFIRNIPPRSLDFTLAATRAALLKNLHVSVTDRGRAQKHNTGG